VDDVVIFIRLTKDDVNNLRDLLANSGVVTGLQTNLQKTTVSVISCSGINIEEILTGFPITRVHFPIKYLGLPLSTKWLRKVDF
jgi:hypothetical protein